MKPLIKSAKLSQGDFRLIDYIDKIIHKNRREINIYSYTLLKGRNILVKKIVKKNEEYVKLKQQLMEKIVKLSSYYFISDEYFEELKKALNHTCKAVWKVKMALISRGIVGMSESFGQIPYEIGISFHPIFNVPYIPSSTIKGAVRNAGEELGHKNEEIKDMIEKLFGTQNNIGIIGFTDAFPIESEIKYILYPDIITPHYSKAKSELDVNPNPLAHLNIAPGTVFMFLVYARKKLNSNLEHVLLMSLLYAMARGIGARTSVGYSLFKPHKIVKLEGD